METNKLQTSKLFVYTAVDFKDEIEEVGARADIAIRTEMENFMCSKFFFSSLSSSGINFDLCGVCDEEKTDRSPFLFLFGVGEL